MSLWLRAWDRCTDLVLGRCLLCGERQGAAETRDSASHGSAQLDSAQLDSAQLDSAQLDSAQHGGDDPRHRDGGHPSGAPSGVVCAACFTTPVPRFTVAGVPGRSAALYDGPVGALVRRLKYGDETRWATPLARLLQARLGTFIPPHAALVPVPLHPARLAERGFNQSALLARALGRRTNQPVLLGVLRRTRSTTAQALLDRSARLENVTGAFDVVNAPRQPLVLLDDVTTTGTTLRECILCLRRAGAIVDAVVTVALAEDRGSPTAPSLDQPLP